MLLSEILKLAKIQAPLAKDMEIARTETDSRRVQAGDLFVLASKSDELDNKYAGDAIQKGAVGILTDNQNLKSNIPVFYVEKPALVLGTINQQLYQPLPEVLTAVTGTNGKTSTVSFVRQIFELSGIEAASFGTLGLQSKKYSDYTGLTTADNVILYRDLNKIKELSIDNVSIEASSHALHQDRMAGLKFKTVGFTNFTQDHLDYHQTMEAYFEAKTKLFTDYMEDSGTAVLNADIPEYEKLKTLCEKRGLRVFSYGFKGQELKLLAQNLHSVGQNLSLSVFGKEYDLETKITGSFQAWNALCALGMVIACGMDAETALKTLPLLQNPDGRMEFVATTSKGASIYVDYAHTPDGIENALKSLKHHVENKLWIAFGCGGNRDKTKRPIMGKLAHDFADVVIVTDDNPRFENPAEIRKEIMAAAPNAIEAQNRTEAIQYAIKHAEKGDVVLLAGKGHEDGQIINGVTYPFNDKQEVLKNLI